MKLIDGKIISQKVKEELKRKVSTLIKKPSLAVIRVGEDEASKIYIKLKQKMCEELGINFAEYHLKESIEQEDLLGLIHKLNADDETTAILLQSPIPYHLNILEAFKAISPEKDVDGFNPVNVGKLAIGQRTFAPCTPLRYNETTIRI